MATRPRKTVQKRRARPKPKVVADDNSPPEEDDPMSTEDVESDEDVNPLLKKPERKPKQEDG